MTARIRAEQLMMLLPAGDIVGAELGVWRGQMSELLLKREDMTLYMVDNWKPINGIAASGFSVDEQRKNRFLAWKLTDFANQRRIVLDMDSVRAARFVPDDSLDFVFVDADHSYDGVKADIEAWFPKLKNGAWLSGHDYDNEGERYGGEVQKAVDEAFWRIGGQLMLGADHTWFMRKT